MTPDITSYDYSAPISESGKLTDRFWVFRKTVEGHLGYPLPQPPPDPEFISLPPISFTRAAGMFDHLPQPVESRSPMVMEDLDQSHGFILYRTEVEGPLRNAPLVMNRLMDRAIVFLNGKRMGTADRRHGARMVNMDVPAGKHQLDILVENMGRVNYGGAITTENKGITEGVTLAGNPVEGFRNFSLPCAAQEIASLPFAAAVPSGEQPVFYQSRFLLDRPGDTFLDMQDGWTKGLVWVNGHNLGRFWFIGPQQALYCPAPFLKKGENEIIVLDLEGGRGTIRGIREQVWKTNTEKNSAQLHRKPGQTVHPDKTALAKEGTFQPGETWQEIKFDQPVSGRYFALEALNALDGKEYAAVAELEILDAQGKPLKKEEWSVAYADSEEIQAEQGNAELVMDRQPVTFWHTAWSSKPDRHPHLIVLDLGGERKISGFHYLPRPGASGGKIKDYRIYVSSRPFPGQ